ncbi:MAG: exopolysaccharide biosynthesis protein [Chthoniobacterales bacterium]
MDETSRTPNSPPPHEGSAPATLLSEELESLLVLADGKPLKLRTVVEHLHFRGLPALIVLLCVPFLFPVSVPGLSMPFGLAIALCGLRLGLGHKLWMPDFLLRREVSAEVLAKLVGGAARFYRRVEKLVKPRMHFLQRWPGMLNLLGFMIMIGGVLLSLPIPPPFPLTNTIPGLAIIFMALGLMERDGVCILIGYAFALVAFFYIGMIFLLGTAGVQYLWDWCFG